MEAPAALPWRPLRLPAFRHYDIHDLNSRENICMAVEPASSNNCPSIVMHVSDELLDVLDACAESVSSLSNECDMTPNTGTVMAAAQRLNRPRKRKLNQLSAVPPEPLSPKQLQQDVNDSALSKASRFKEKLWTFFRSGN